jgi:homoserine dehydrogenase
VEGSQNLIAAEGRHSRESVFSGLGAGGHPTAVAVLSDVLSTVRGLVHPERTHSASIARVVGHLVAPHYLRFIVLDRPGIIARIADALARRDINIDAVWQEPGHEKSRLPFVMTVEACSSAVVQAALRDVTELDFHVEPPLALPIL